MAEQKFEAGMKRLEEIVAKMESGDLPLDDSLKLFEEGIKLSRTLNKTLETAERKVEALVRGADGSLGTVPFDEGDEE